MHGHRPHVPVTDPVLLAVAMRMEIDPNETDWMEIDPFEVVLACASRNLRKDFDWTDFERARTTDEEPKFPNRYVFLPTDDPSHEEPFTPDI